MATGNDDSVLTLPDGDLVLKRPHQGGRSLRAWDAADEYLVREVRDRLEPGQQLVVVDDSFGALTLGLADFRPTVISDSAVLALALQGNSDANGMAVPVVSSWLDELGWLRPGEGASVAPTRFDAVVMKVPRQQDYLEFLLRWVNDVLRPGGVLLTGGMIKHLPAQAAGLYQAHVVTGEVLPAWKKARVVVCHRGASSLAGWLPLWQSYQPDAVSAPVAGLPAVFARHHLDIGTRVLLPLVRPAVTGLAAGSRVLDLACGNGVLGLAASVARPDLQITFADISSQALISAAGNLARQECQEPVFLHADGLPQGAGQFELILLNPPFHEGGAVGDHIALRLFAIAARHLKPGGRLLVVGNRHLGYHRSLRSYFGAVRQSVSHPKFVVLEATRPR